MMIELNNISKTYRSKKGNNTKALDNISLKFDDKGMTFILGKSGSGKSTLLNVIGGLDKYDSGDITILGKSSKEFKSADFDSYRNTYIGFVFQEFNILEDYNVYENIVIALQLQKKKVNPKEINSLLEKLELLDLKTRKVNELSGGQKQRVAIARALIKNPKIILADEPTGNLDSETGKQVMNLLKEISKEKLVIVVSHDNESANTYGDRIIEIKDGNVINDVKKQEFNNSNVETYQTVKSKLPIKESIKLGLGSLRHKKIKLCFTILLVLISLLFLSMIDTLSSYNINEAHSKLLNDKKEEFVQIEKYRFYSDEDFVNKEQIALTDDEITDIQKRLNRDSILVYKVTNDGGYGFANVYDVFNIPSEFGGYSYDYGELSLEIVEDSSFDYVSNFTLIGKKPTNNDEIIISNAIADLMIEHGVNVYGENKVYFPKNYDEIINSNNFFTFNESGKIKIVGIIDYDVSKYKDVLQKHKELLEQIRKNPDTVTIKMTDDDNSLLNEYSAKLNNIYNKIYVRNGFVNSLELDNNLPLNNSLYHYDLNSDEVKIRNDGIYISPSLIHNSIEYYDGSKWVSSNKLDKNEIVVNVKQLEGFDLSNYHNKLTEYVNKNLGREQVELEKEFLESYIEDLDVVGKKANLKVFSTNNDNNRENYDNLTIIGVTGLISNNDNYYYVSDQLMSKYEIEIVPKTSMLVFENRQNEFKKMMSEFPYNEQISLKSTYSYDVNSMVRTINILRKIAFYIAIVFLVFTIILIANFMFSSISYRKREIGILRGLGARNIDVVKIFLWEGIILAGISFILASIGLFVVTNLLNNVIMGGMNLLITPFIIGLRQFIVMFVLVYVIVFISSIIPIIKTSKMKPIDAILKK